MSNRFLLTALFCLFVASTFNVSAQGNVQYVYDAASRLKEVRYVDKTIVYSYDAAGNRTAVSVSSVVANPSILSLSPSSATVGGSGFTLTVTGTNFTNGSTILWNGTQRPTTFVSSTQLTASISASDISTLGVLPVTVSNNASVVSNAVSFTVQSAGECISAGFSSNQIVPLNSSIAIPISVPNVTGRGIRAFEFSMMFDPKVIQIDSNFPIDTTGTVSNGYDIVANTTVSGRLSVAAYGVGTLSGSGPLLKINFNVIGQDGSGSSLAFLYFRFNEGDPCSNPISGTVSVSQASNSIAGAISFGTTPPEQGLKPVPGVLLTAIGAFERSTTSDALGSYSLLGLGTGQYAVTPSKSGDVNTSAISALDASSVAQYSVGLIPLTANQQIAADVTNDGTISALDASRIAQWSVGLTVPAGDLTGKWRFTPSSRNYPSITESLTGQDFTAILMGDVTGNWIPAPSLGSLESLESSESRKTDREDVAKAIGFGLSDGEIRIPGIRSSWSDSFRDKSCVESRSKVLNVTNENVGKTSLPADTCLLSTDLLEIPISIGEATGILGYDAVITYDADVLEPVVEKPIESNRTLSMNFNIVVNRSEPGKLKIAAYGITPVAGDGDLIILRFKVKKPNAKIEDAKLEFDSLVINEREIVSPLTRIK